MINLSGLFQSLGISRDSAVWFWGKFAGTVLFLASIGADATALGIPEAWLRGIQVLALWVTYMSAQNSTSVLEGASAEPEVDPESIDMANWVKVLEVLGPAVLAATPAAPVIPFVMAGIKIAEKMPNATGAQKKQFVLDFVELAGGAAGALKSGQPPAVTAEAPVATTPQANEVGLAIDQVIDIVNLVQRKL